MANRGFTLVEIAITMGIVGMILATVWVASKSVFENYKVNAVNQQVMTVVQNVRQAYGTIGALPAVIAPCSGGDLVCTLGNIIPSLMPAEMRSSASVFNHALASSTTGTFHLLSQSNTVMRVQLMGLTQTDCERLLMEMPVLMPEVGVNRIGTTAALFASVNVLNISSPGGTTTLPINSTTASTWCAAAGATNEVDIDFNLHS